MLEKAAAGLGAIGFIWASCVLLGGFASSLAKSDFWFINVILLIEGIRIFSRRQIIRWQHDARWSLTGAVRRCLRPIKSSVRFVVGTLTLAKVGITTSVMARLVQMLNWKEVEQRGIREAAAEILVKLAGPKHKPLQVASIPGVMESISSLLFYSRSAAASAEISVRTSHFESEHHDLLEFVNLGLRLLKKLCCDHGSCEKIGSTRGLLLKIIYFT
ncbi:hypothetical protein RJ640_002976 [Escallonia rubra]|uniref:Uncharacterized protein n=1 Tax=Escallonia rubra TaxID=112253 RepID=A0AA88R256_9ASTE|nr:hypothetical protein RJ640_002976 [Escallonia rubra]